MTRFASPPHHLVDEFKRHVAETGQPETFAGITNDRPPAEGEVVALWTGIQIPQARRPNRDMAPCWICNEGRSKWLHDGTLIWCAHSERIYAIGPECYRNHFGDRLDIALNLLRRTQQEELNALRLHTAVAAAPEQLAWIADHIPIAEQADRLHAEFARAVPKLRNSISRQLKSASVAVRGTSFLRGTWTLVEKLRSAEKEWRQLVARVAGANPVEWATNLAPRQVEERLQDIARARTAMETVAARLNDAADFTSGESIRSLAAWSRQAIVPFTARSTATQFEIRSADDEYFRGRANLPRPQPPPQYR